MSQGHPPLVAPKSNGDRTSVWFALRYIKNQIPNISASDLVRLTASIGAETKDRYTFATVIHATEGYKQGNGFPSVSGWPSHVGHVVQAASRHGHKDWVHGFSYSGTDIPGTGGPSNVQKIADSKGADAVVGGVKGIGSFFSGSNFIGIAVIVVILIVLLGKK